jgi:hypothetical protein
MRSAVLFSAGLLLLATPLAAQTEIPEELSALKDPRISERPAEKMLVVEVKGDPAVMGGQAFGLVFQLYYRMPETPKGPEQGAPRARWPVDLEQPRSEWVGLYALPVPQHVSELPSHTAPAGFDAKLTVWEYGDVAEILHVGPYDREAPTLERLKALVEAEGYTLTGGHEEEYIRGPTMSGPGDPEQYLTILRYRVEKQ